MGLALTLLNRSDSESSASEDERSVLYIHMSVYRYNKSVCIISAYCHTVRSARRERVVRKAPASLKEFLKQVITFAYVQRRVNPCTYYTQ